MAEGSKAPVNSPRELGGVGLNPAAANKIVFALFLCLFDHSALCFSKNVVPDNDAEFQPFCIVFVYVNTKLNKPSIIVGKRDSKRGRQEVLFYV